MTGPVLVDLVVVVVLLIAAWSGGRTGAARSAISLLALAIGLWISAQGQSAIVHALAQLLPGADLKLIAIGIFIGGIWIVLALASYLVGRALQTTLRAIHLGPLDTALGAVFGVVCWSVLLAAIVFVCDVGRSIALVLPTPLNEIEMAISSAQSSEILRGAIYPVAGQLVGGILPEGLRAILLR